MKYSGYVKYFDRTRGDGLVAVRKSPTDQDCIGNIFIHYSSLPGAGKHSVVHVKDFAPIKFDIVDGFYGPQAHRVEYDYSKTRIEVVEDVLVNVLDNRHEKNSDLFIRIWICNLRKIAREEGHLCYGPIWDY